MDYLTIGGLTFRRSAALQDRRLESCSIQKEAALDAGDLAFDTMTADLFAKEDGAKLVDLSVNTPVNVFKADKLYASFVLTSVFRTGPYTYSIEAASPLSCLTKMEHPGGIYTGQTAESVIKEICGNVPVLVETAYKERKIYGWLPYVKPPSTSARDNLAQVLFVIGAHLCVDQNGVLRVQKLWNGAASTIENAYEGGSLTYEAPVSSVSVTAHQYVPGTEAASLFDGTAEEGMVVIFQEPMHSLSASGVSIISSGANHAVLSAGTGTLTGKKYVHNTTSFKKSVSETAGGAENEKSVTSATLVSPLDGHAVATRLVEHYRCRTILKKGAVAGSEKPGHVVQIYDPYDKKMVDACINTVSTRLSGTTKNEISALVGFRPQQPENAEYFDTCQRLTGSGTVTVPEGASTMTVVLIGGGQGGGCGGPGQAALQKSLSWTQSIAGGAATVSWSGYWAAGGKGGAGGLPGSGGRVRQVTLDVQPGASISYACGTGGAAAPYDPEQAGKIAGAEGSPTTLTVGGITYTTAEGAPSASGFADPTGGDVYAAPGRAGTAGGDGGGMDLAYSALTDAAAATPIPAGSVVDEDGTVWNGGDHTRMDNGSISERAPAWKFFTERYADGGGAAAASAVLGGGAAAGSHGPSGVGRWGSASVTRSPSTGTAKSISALANGGVSVGGADAQPPKRPTRYGAGGSGGNGGGGAGAPGYAVVGRFGHPVGTLTARASVGTLSPGGKGSEGSAGADGCILLYFHQSRKLDAGPVVSKTKWYLDRLGRRLIV